MPVGGSPTKDDLVSERYAAPLNACVHVRGDEQLSASDGVLLAIVRGPDSGIIQSAPFNFSFVGVEPRKVRLDLPTDFLSIPFDQRFG